jgi:hypothetical protein
MMIGLQRMKEKMLIKMRNGKWECDDLEDFLLKIWLLT